MRKSILAIVVLALLNSLLAATAFAAPSVRNLKPGQVEVFEKTIPVNIVLVGYEQEQINQEAMLDVLPASSEPVVRYPRFYGLEGRPMGLHFDYSYNVINAPTSFENSFFAYLKQAGKPGDPTLFQELYNEQESNVRDVEGPVLYIDAPSVENWLTYRGRDVFNFDYSNYTVYLINWYARDDFQFHVYTKTDNPDPDTDYNFGALRESRKIIAWGGNAGRTWFYDLSAGPESWTSNWNITDEDLDGDGVADYRMPPVWEYDDEGYRAPTALSSDLGLVIRYAAINLLFTSSPLYDPLVTTPERGGSKINQIELFETDPAQKGKPFIDTRFVQQQLSRFQPYYRWQTKLDVNDPADAEVERTLQIFFEIINEPDCWTNYGSPFAQLFCYFSDNRAEYLPEVGPNDYQIPIFNFNLDDETAEFSGLLGFADDNYVDGTQSFVFSFDAPLFRESGYGFSTTTVHEVGHHIGMSHPHDGYDSESDFDYGPSGPTFFAWSGDESATTMSYVDLETSFGRFDRDNMYRWEAAGHLNEANRLVGEVLETSNADVSAVKKAISTADLYYGRAKNYLLDWQYEKAVRAAYLAYLAATDAANAAGVDVADVASPARFDPAKFPGVNVPWYVLDNDMRHEK